jgi:hypothetical protein
MSLFLIDFSAANFTRAGCAAVDRIRRVPFAMKPGSPTGPESPLIQGFFAAFLDLCRPAQNSESGWIQERLAKKEGKSQAWG